MGISAIALIIICAVFAGSGQSITDTISANKSADANPEKLTISGYARGSVYMWGEDHDYATVFSEMGLKNELQSRNIRLLSAVDWDIFISMNQH